MATHQKLEGGDPGEEATKNKALSRLPCNNLAQSAWLQEQAILTADNTTWVPLANQMNQ